MYSQASDAGDLASPLGGEGAPLCLAMGLSEVPATQRDGLYPACVSGEGLGPTETCRGAHNDTRLIPRPWGLAFLDSEELFNFSHTCPLRSFQRLIVVVRSSTFHLV